MRAQAKRSGDNAPESAEQKRQRLEKLISSTDNKLQAAEEKWRQASDQGDNNAEAFASAVEKLRSKLTAARAELQQHQSEEAADTPTTQEGANDPAQAAIARAMASRQAQATMSDSEKQHQAIAALQSRVDKTRTKLAQAREQGADTVAILEDTLNKLEAKLADAKQQAGAESSP